MRTSAVILAGGRGERFWPASRKRFPKQFLSLDANGETLIQQTVSRILPLVDAVFVVTNEAYKNLVEAQLCQNEKINLPKENVIFEPCARNTAPAIALAALHAKKRFGDAVLAILPSDHIIKNAEKYRENFQRALEIAAQGENIATIGIKPTYAETGYGYIQFDKDDAAGKVLRFKEKPDLETARKYLESGDYLWNAGQFFAKSSTILNAMEKFSPKSFSALQKIYEKIGGSGEKDALCENFERCENLPFDIAVAEKSPNLFVVQSEFDWDDVGSWAAAARIADHDGDGNAFFGEVAACGAKNCYVKSWSASGKKLVALVGVEDLAVVDTDDALLVCKKSECQNIKKILEDIKNRRAEEFL